MNSSQSVVPELRSLQIFFIICLLFFSLSGSQAFSTARFGAGSGPIHMDDVQCSGTESRLLNCRYTSRHNCGHSEDASVRCQPPPCRFKN